MQQSNGYIIGFAAVMTIVLGGALAFAAQSLKPAQEKAKALDTKKQILSAVMVTKGEDKNELSKIYDGRVKSIVVDSTGTEIDSLIAEKVNIRKESKKPHAERSYPVYLYYESGNQSGKPTAYILPLFGKGLWDDIWGYVALEPDFQTVKGISFDHKGETPGLGARITDPNLQARYKGKKLYKGDELISVNMMKGENNKELSPHQVDGMSGATITGKGVNNMLLKYIEAYEGYFAVAKAGM